MQETEKSSVEFFSESGFNPPGAEMAGLTLRHS